jgi:hypothetical protein
MRGFAQRILLGILGTVTIALLACPAPKPPVNPTPDASDASQAVSCATACPHAASVCPTVNLSTCESLCGRIGTLFAVKLYAASSCADVKAAGQ